MNGQAKKQKNHYLKPDSIVCLIGKTSSGKTFKCRQFLLHFSDIFGCDIDRITIFSLQAQSELLQNLVRFLPPKVQLIHVKELRTEHLTKERLRSPKPKGHAVVVFDDQVTKNILTFLY